LVDPVSGDSLASSPEASVHNLQVADCALEQTVAMSPQSQFLQKLIEIERTCHGHF
jgi:hypothetical protein